MSVGEFLLLAAAVSALVAYVLVMLADWRKDRLLAILQVIMLAILLASIIAGNHYLGKNLGWLTVVVPMAAFLGVLWLVGRHRR